MAGLSFEQALAELEAAGIDTTQARQEPRGKGKAKGPPLRTPLERIYGRPMPPAPSSVPTSDRLGQAAAYMDQNLLFGIPSTVAGAFKAGMTMQPSAYMDMKRGVAEDAARFAQAPGMGDVNALLLSPGLGSPAKMAPAIEGMARYGGALPQAVADAYRYATSGPALREQQRLDQLRKTAQTADRGVDLRQTYQDLYRQAREGLPPEELARRGLTAPEFAAPPRVGDVTLFGQPTRQQWNAWEAQVYAPGAEQDRIRRLQAAAPEALPRPPQGMGFAEKPPALAALPPPPPGRPQVTPQMQAVDDKMRVNRLAVEAAGGRLPTYEGPLISQLAGDNARRRIDRGDARLTAAGQEFRAAEPQQRVARAVEELTTDPQLGQIFTTRPAEAVAYLRDKYGADPAMLVAALREQGFAIRQGPFAYFPPGSGGRAAAPPEAGMVFDQVMGKGPPVTGYPRFPQQAAPYPGTPPNALATGGAPPEASQTIDAIVQALRARQGSR